jgi:hypothetical protein
MGATNRPQELDDAALRFLLDFTIALIFIILTIGLLSGDFQNEFM